MGQPAGLHLMEKHLLPQWNLIYSNQCIDEFALISCTLLLPWCVWAFRWSNNAVYSQVSRHLCTSPLSCLGIVWCGKYTGLSVIVSIICLIRSQYPRSSSCKEKTSLLSCTRSMKWLCWSHVKLASSPVLSWKGSQSISFLKSKSVEMVSGLGPNSGFSISGLVGLMGPASTWQLLVSVSWVGTGWNPIEMLSPSQSMVALYSISVHSASYNSAASKGCLTHTLYLLVLIIITGIVLAFGIATHQLITMPSGRLWCSTCSTGLVILGGNLLMCPGIVMEEFPGMQIGCCLMPMVTWPINPSFLIKDGWAFL